MAVNTSEPRDQRRPVFGLELGEFTAVDDSCDHLVYVVGHPRVRGNDVVELTLVGHRVDGRREVPRRIESRPERRDDTSHDPQRVAVVMGQMSVTPEVFECRSPPPRSSAVTTSPVAAFTSGGPPKKIVPWLRTMTASSLIAGTYAPPAVHEPSTAAIWGMPSALIVAWL